MSKTKATGVGARAGVERIEASEELLAAIEECGRVVMVENGSSWDLTRVYLDAKRKAVVGTDRVRMHVVPMDVPELAHGRLVYPKTWRSGARQVVTPDCCLTGGDGVSLPLGDGCYPRWWAVVPKPGMTRGDPHLALYAEELRGVLKVGSPVRRVLKRQAEEGSGCVQGCESVQALVLTRVGEQVEFRVPLAGKGAGCPVGVMDAAGHRDEPFDFCIQPRFLLDILSTPSLFHEGLLRFWYLPTPAKGDEPPGPRLYLRGRPRGPYHVLMGMGVCVGSGT